jgi:hypothetical protein
MEESGVEWIEGYLKKFNHIEESLSLRKAFERAKKMENKQAVDFAYDIADDLACGVLDKKAIEDRYNEFFKSE